MSSTSELEPFLIGVSREAERVAAAPATGQNRQERRRIKFGTKSKPIGDMFKHLALEINQSGSKMNSVFKLNDGDITKIIYQGDPYIVPFLTARHSLHSILEIAQWRNLETPVLTTESMRSFEINDIFATNIKGTSLGEIEEMPQPLSIDDIQRINRMLRRVVPLFKEHYEHNNLRTSMIVFATQKFARPEEKIEIPHQLQPLFRRLTDYFDYYTKFMTDFSLDEIEEGAMWVTLGWTRPWLPNSIGRYLPARMGITPSSAIKLYKEKTLRSPLHLLSIAWSSLLPTLEGSSKEAFRKDGLPADLQKNQLYDPEMDKKAERVLRNHYPKDASFQDHQRREDLLKEFLKYHPVLIRDVEKAASRRLTIIPSEPRIFSSLTLASQYPQTLICIMQLPENNHLTVEINRDGDLFGIPAKVNVENPHLVDLLLADILDPILDEVKSRYPIREPVKLATYRSTQPILPPLEIPRLDYQPRPESKEKRSKIPRVLTPIAQYLAQPRPPTLSEIHIPKLYVQYSQDLVTAYLGNKVPERIIKQIMTTLRNFEYGRIPIKKLEDAGDLWDLRSGSYRIILKHDQGLNYQIEAIASRQGVFKRHRVSSAKYS